MTRIFARNRLRLGSFRNGATKWQSDPWPQSNGISRHSAEEKLFSALSAAAAAASSGKLWVTEAGWAGGGSRERGATPASQTHTNTHTHKATPLELATFLFSSFTFTTLSRRKRRNFAPNFSSFRSPKKKNRTKNPRNVVTGSGEDGDDYVDTVALFRLRIRLFPRTTTTVTTTNVPKSVRSSEKLD